MFRGDPDVTDVESRASAWISNEIGMAYALDLPLMICPEDTVEDLGLAKMATSYNDFNRNNLASFKSGLHVYFREIKQDPRIKEGPSLGNFVNNLARAALSGHTSASTNDAATLTKLTTLVDTLVEGSSLHMFSFGESDEFTEKRREHLIEKQAIAKYVTLEGTRIHLVNQGLHIFVRQLYFRNDRNS